MRRSRGLLLFVLLLAVVTLNLGHHGRRGGGATRKPKDLPQGPTERPLMAGDAQDNYGGYSYLLDGTLYAGTVLSVTVKALDPVEFGGNGPLERGTLHLRVDRTVIGPPQKELVLGYWTTPQEGAPDGRPILTTDWADVESPWGHRRPRPGEHLLVLLTGDKRSAENLNGVGGGSVWHVWRGVAARHGLVRGFEDAGNYLRAKDDKTRGELFRRLCQSPFRGIRLFALDAAFYPVDRETNTIYGGNYDPVRQSRVVLDFLRLAVPRMFAEERPYVTGGFSYWLGHDWHSRVTEEARAAFEDWYVTELAARDPERRLRALNGLKELIEARVAFEAWYLEELGAVNSERRWWAVEGLKQLAELRGVAAALGLFKKSGRAGLARLLRACADAADEETRKLSRELLDKLGDK
jgi:hypothetical protein